MTKMHIGKIIREKLEEVGMSKSEFSRRINTSPQNVYGIFKRKSIDTDLLQQISDVLGIDFFNYYGSRHSMVEEQQASYTRTKKKDEAESQPGELEKCRAELQQALKEISYLKKINELLEKQQDKSDDK